MHFVSLLVLLLSGRAHAHIQGSGPWCIQTSMTHMVCEFDNQKTCLQSLKKVQKRKDFFTIPAGEAPSQKLDPLCTTNPNVQNQDDGLKKPTSF